MPINVKTYDGSDDTEDHLNLFQAAAKVERWSIPTWCHMFNSTLIGSDRQKKCIKDPVEIHHIKQREGESTKDFVERFKTESRHVRGAPECMKIFGFMHGITNPELIKRLHDNIPKSVDEMMRESGRKQNFDRKGDFQNQQRSERRRDKFTFLSKSPREILPLEKGKFKTPPPMTMPVEKRNSSKFCKFHREVGHNTDECMHLKRQIKELIKNGKLLHVIKELKQGSRKERLAQPKAAKQRRTFESKDMLSSLIFNGSNRGKALARQKNTQKAFLCSRILFPPLGMMRRNERYRWLFEAKIGGHFVTSHFIVDEGSPRNICMNISFIRLSKEVKNQMVLATTPLIGFSGEIIWPKTLKQPNLRFSLPPLLYNTQPCSKSTSTSPQPRVKP
ncbi:hypothetical protein Tco_1134888 [Tanacetum coccineum]